jgi:aspartate carbamoyltransferase catalytic subunit
MIITKPKIKNIVSVKDFSVDFINSIFQKTILIKQNPKSVRGIFFDKIFATVFYEPSTRTRLSFESAINRLGGKLITVENAKENSSGYKGESLVDTIKTISNYADCIILRHGDDDAADVASDVCEVPFINAGSGKNEHPTQALLDGFTIYEKFGKMSDLNITIVGDLFRGRTVYSLVYLLSKFNGNKFTFVSRENSKINENLRKYLIEHDVIFKEVNKLEEELAETDILYVTRIQKERCASEGEYEEAKKGMTITKDILGKLNKDAIIMHPLPRVDEIDISVDSDPRAYYFKQVENGVFVRMAILLNILS